jgi:hypothetical protein
MTGTGTGNTAGQNFSTFGSEFPQTSNIFVIDGFYLIYTESTNFFAALAIGACGTFGSFGSFHNTDSPYLNFDLF